jgi:hypothetical protein
MPKGQTRTSVRAGIMCARGLEAGRTLASHTLKLRASVCVRECVCQGRSEHGRLQTIP